MTRYASGKHALGICDRCGFRYKLRELVFEASVTGTPTYRVCKTCFDPVHPQLIPPRVQPDAQALWEPRPDTGLAASREIPPQEE